MSKNTSITISDIFELLKNGKQCEGVDLLYKRYYRKMYGIAFSIVKKEDVSEDIVHNVICKLLLLNPSKLPTSSELTWLYTVVKNESLIFLRNDKHMISFDAVGIEPIVEDKDIHDFIDMDSYYSMIMASTQRLPSYATSSGFNDKVGTGMLNLENALSAAMTTRSFNVNSDNIGSYVNTKSIYLEKGQRIRIAFSLKEKWLLCVSLIG